MKFRYIITLTTVLSFFATAALAQSILGSAHDLSDNDVWGADADDSIDNGEVCVYCHTPHSGSSGAPLWNKDTTAATYTMYDSATLEAPAGTPGPQSLSCLTCHDGTIATDSMTNAPGLDATVEGTHFMGDTNPGYVGTDLSDDHPIAVNLADAAGTDTGLQVPTVARLYHDVVECASCHSVHDPSYGSFLRASNADSALCLDCHIK